MTRSTWAGKLRGHARETAQLWEALAPASAVTEQLAPGCTEHGRKLDAGVDESMQRAAGEAEREVAVLLAAPVKPELVEHWKSPGGRLPDPL